MAHQFFFNSYILDNLPAPSVGFDVVQDLSEPRLRLYITSRGVKTFFVRKRVRGHDKRIIIGNYPKMEIEEARDSVQRVLDTALQPPCNHKRKITLKSFFNMYLVHRVRRAQYSKDKLVRAVHRHIGELLNKNISEITAQDVQRTVASIQGPAIAGRMQELLQSIFKYATESGYISENPVAGLARVPQTRRVRPLNKTGLRKLVVAIKKEKNPNLRAAFLMLVYGFAPKSQVFSMQWSQLDFNHYMWADRPLSDAAVVLLQDLPQNGRWVFAGRGRGHLTDPRTAWARIVQRAGIPTLTMDDVNKFLMRKLEWAPDKEELRANINRLLDEILA